MNAPCQGHWEAALHLLRYLKGCPSMGLFYPAHNPSGLEAYSYADWASCLDSRKSFTGFCIYFGKALISWKIKRQTIVSKSSAEAEYRSLAATVCELLWISYLLQDFGINSPSHIPLWCDNKAALHITANPVFHERTKHLDIDCYIVRDQFKKGFIAPQHISSSHQIADIFTKSLSGPQFHYLLSKLGLFDLHQTPT